MWEEVGCDAGSMASHQLPSAFGRKFVPDWLMLCSGGEECMGWGRQGRKEGRHATHNIKVSTRFRIRSTAN